MGLLSTLRDVAAVLDSLPGRAEAAARGVEDAVSRVSDAASFTLPPAGRGTASAPPRFSAAPPVSTGGGGGGGGSSGTGKSRTVQYGWINSITGGPPQLYGTLLEYGQAGVYLMPQGLRAPREVPGWWLGGHFYPDPEAPSPWPERSGTGSGGGPQQGSPRPRGTTTRPATGATVGERHSQGLLANVRPGQDPTFGPGGKTTGSSTALSPDGAAIVDGLDRVRRAVEAPSNRDNALRLAGEL